MIAHDDTVTTLDRVSLTHALFGLAERFELEAPHWAAPIRADLEHAARTLALIARATLRPDYDLNRSEAFYDAGNRIIADTLAHRQFLNALKAQHTQEARP